MSFHLVLFLQPIYFLSHLQCYIDTPDDTPTKTDVPYGAPPHKNETPPNWKANPPHWEAPFQETIPRKKQITTENLAKILEKYV